MKEDRESGKIPKGVDIRYGAVNARVFMDVGEGFKITGHPWVASFYLGKKGEDMAGMGGWTSFYEWGKKEHKRLWKADGVANLEAVVPVAEEAALDADRDAEDPEKVKMAERAAKKAGKNKDEL